MSEHSVTAAIEATARHSYGQLLAYLASRAGGDFSGAEDALGEAFLAALRDWPLQGVPAKPEAWLLSTARRKLIDHQRRAKVRTLAMDQLQYALSAAQSVADAGDAFPDERLKLLFVCAHPAIDEAARTPLMLQTVFGIEAEVIAAAFLVTYEAMSKRLVRAKAKIRDAGIPFQVPLPGELPERLSYVLDAIYAAYTTGWRESTGDDQEASLLAEKAVWLAKVLVQLLPGEPETLGLLALMLHCQARLPARLDENGLYVPLPDQEADRWKRDLQSEAETYLRVASRERKMGRFQLEAAIQSVHAARAYTGTTNWEAIAMLYGTLVQFTGSLGARIGWAVALGYNHLPLEGLAALDRLPQEKVADHLPYWAARADLLRLSHQRAEAQAAYDRAITLCHDRPLRDFLLQRAATLG